jgi:hypothetical protein
MGKWKNFKLGKYSILIGLYSNSTYGIGIRWGSTDPFFKYFDALFLKWVFYVQFMG